MARFRTLKPQTFADEKLIECELPARFLFVGLWCFVDDKGRARYHPKRIKLEVFPGDEKITAKLVDAWMRELDRVGVLRIYTIDSQTYFWIPNFVRHQRIDRPSHTDIPPHPQDRDPDCQCISCQIIRGDINEPRHYGSTAGRKKRDQRRHPTGENVPGFTPRVFHESSNVPGTLVDTSICSKNYLITDIYSINNLNLDPQQQNPASQPHPLSQNLPNSKAEERRTLQRALDEIVLRMIQLLEIKYNSQLLQSVANSVEMKSRSKSISIEAAAQQVAARAAFVAAESPPEDWLLWFADAGYEYVPQGDPRMHDRHVYARPVCGGPGCQEGWEVVKVGGIPVLRRCPNCERLWRDISAD